MGLDVRVELEKLEMLFSAEFAKRMLDMSRAYQLREEYLARHWGANWLRESNDFAAYNTGVKPS